MEKAHAGYVRGSRMTPDTDLGQQQQLQGHGHYGPVDGGTWQEQRIRSALHQTARRPEPDDFGFDWIEAQSVAVGHPGFDTGDAVW